MTISRLEGLLDWQLKHGSHEFPGPDGGTCINEAAVVVAGFPYREVLSIADLPESFCPVIGQFTLTLNDSMPEGGTLNRLRPFAGRLAGSCDTREVALERARFLALAAARDFASIAIEARAPTAAAWLRRAEGLEAAAATIDALATRCWHDRAREALQAAQRALARALANRQAVYTAELAAIAATRAAALDQRAWDAAVAVLDGVLSIGERAEPVAAALADERARAALERV